jgi:hypothetical protein
MNDSYSENVIDARGHDTKHMPRTKKKSVINPAEAYSDAQWEKLNPDLRSELETQYVLSLPGLKKRLERENSSVDGDKWSQYHENNHLKMVRTIYR